MTKKDPQAKRWMLTIPAAEYSKEQVEAALASYTYVGQLEEGEETGYVHWQVYVDNPTGIRFSTLKNKLPTAHLEQAQAEAKACVEYVTKESTSKGVRIRRGTIETKDRSQNAAEKLAEMRLLIASGEKSFSDLIIEEQLAARHVNYLREFEFQIRKKKAQRTNRDIQVHYVYGAPGVGKTRLVYERFFKNPEDLYSATDYLHPFDAYDNEKALLLDEFVGQIDFTYLLKLLDRYPMQLSARYANKFAGFTEVWLLSNLPLSDLYRDVQVNSHAQWNALMRRITTYQRMEDDGSLVDVPLPVK